MLECQNTSVLNTAGQQDGRVARVARNQNTRIPERSEPECQKARKQRARDSQKQLETARLAGRQGGRAARSQEVENSSN